MLSPSRVVFAGAFLFGVVACGSEDGTRRVRPADGGMDAASGGKSTGSGGARASGGAPASGGARASGGAAAGGAPGNGGAVPDASTPDGGDSTDSGDAAPEAAGPNPLDRWVDPVNGDDTHDGTSDATAYKSITKGLPEILAGGTLWLMDGAYSPDSGEVASSGYNTFTIADGAFVRAVHPGSVTLGGAATAPPGFTFAGSGALEGVAFVGLPIAVKASAGTVSLSGITIATAGGGCSSFDEAAFVFTGTAKVALEAGAVTEFSALSRSIQGVARVTDDAEFAIHGGAFTELGTSRCSPSTAFNLDKQGKLRLEGVTIKDAPAQNRMGTITLHGDSELTLVDVVIDGDQAPAVRIDYAAAQKVSLLRTTIQGAPAAISLGYEGEASAPVIDITDSLLTKNGVGIGGSGYTHSIPTLTIEDTQITDNTTAGIFLYWGGSIDVSGGAISGNGSTSVQGGGLIFANLSGTASYAVKLRGVSVTNNVGNGVDVGGIVLKGVAGSTFDFGKVSAAGSNVFTGNMPAALNLKTDPAVTVYAVGNTWDPGIQGATGGKYTVAGAGAKLDVTTGTGTNYSFQAGSGPLRLAENP